VSLPDDPSESQAEFAFEWAQSAQHIDPEIHPELAALWQCLLAQISINSIDVRRRMTALKQLESVDAVILLDQKIKMLSLEPDAGARLFKAGIIGGGSKACTFFSLKLFFFL
jgi:hypothetical protein